MRDTDLFQLALGLKSPWMVTCSEFAVGNGQLDLYVDFPPPRLVLRVVNRTTLAAALRAGEPAAPPPRATRNARRSDHVRQVPRHQARQRGRRRSAASGGEEQLPDPGPTLHLPE